MAISILHQTKKLGASAALWIILSSAVYAQAWQVAPFPSKEPLNGVSFLSPDTGFVVSGTGMIGRTTDAGKSWKGVQVANASLEDIFFADSRTVYVCGAQGGVFKSEDGGRTWKNRSIPDTAATLLSVRRLTAYSLLVTGLKPDSTRSVIGVAMRSADDGVTWQALPNMGIGYGEMLVTPDKTARFLSWGALHTSIDYGKTWTETKLPDGKPGRTLDIAGNTGIMAGNFGQVAYSTDAGKTWHNVEIAKEESHFTSVVLVNSNSGYVAGFDSKMYRTLDGGKTWSKDQLPVVCSIIAMTKVGNRIWAVGDNGTVIYKNLK
jgi:photosystem II stability/assembly factor-like uncharacterized protein